MGGTGGGKSAAAHTMTSKLYVGNLPYTTTAQELHDLFAPAGSVAAVDLVFDKFTGRSLGFAFVTMLTLEDTRRALGLLYGAALGGQILTIAEACDREESTSHLLPLHDRVFF